jgi:hypothetical protein
MRMSLCRECISSAERNKRGEREREREREREKQVNGTWERHTVY